MMSAAETKALVLEAFDTLFNKRDYAKAAQFWSENYIQHSAHIGPGRDGLFDLVRSAPSTLRYENARIVVDGGFVMLHGRFSGHGRPRAWVAADIVRMEGRLLAEHWDVLQDEATQEESRSGLPMFGAAFLNPTPVARRRKYAEVMSVFRGLAVAGTVAGALVVGGCGTDSPAAPSSKAIVTFAVQDETFRVSLTSDEQLAAARAAQGGGPARIPTGRIVAGTQANTGWSWHLEDLTLRRGDDRGLRRAAIRRGT